ncbi:triple tyrosine motif-containing protein [Sinomicrobium oceani]|uniref:triple tyrosine motif-containing protein n=1 Tax=Sinomicrobium oceani TaxID=1150368 RepID=UPI00227D1209|nr:triple tyrosine motif-containing protein [Sinomicrobium oceani]
MAKSLYILIWLGMVCCFRVGGQETPPVFGFSPESYDGGNQNWMLAQGDDAHMYVANNSGLLEYNGAQWQRYQIKEGEVIRAVMASGDRIYTGGYMDFGYWEHRDNGSLAYTSLVAYVDSGILYGEQFWHIEEIGNYILFQSPARLYSYHKQDHSVTIIPSDNIILNLFTVNGNAYYQAVNEGLYVIENGKSRLVLAHEELQDNMVVGLYPYQGKLLAVTRNSGIFTIENKVWEPVAVEGYPYAESIFVSRMLSDHTLALGSIGNGLYTINPVTAERTHYNQPTLINNTVLSLFEDRYGNIWCGTDNGISVINRQSSATLFNDTFGKIGTVYCSLLEGDLQYLGTNQGLYFRDIAVHSNYKLVAGTKGQVWSVDRIGGRIYAGHDRGTFLLDRDQAKLIFGKSGTWTLQAFDGGIVQGHYDGLTYIDESGAVQDIKGFDLSSRNIVAEHDSVLWIAHDHNGIFRLNTGPGATIKKVKSFPADENISLGISVFKFNDSIYYSTAEHIYKYDPEAGDFTAANDLERITRPVKRITGTSRVTEDGTWWGFGEDGIFYTATDAFRNKLELHYVPIPKEYRSITTRFENISQMGEGQYLVGSSRGYAAFSLPYQGSVPEKLRIQAVEVAGKGEQYELMALKSTETELPGKTNFIRFQYSIPQYSRLNDIKYSYRIRNYISDWSEWQLQSSADFKNIPSGDYVFEVRAKINGRLTDPESFPFTVASPWYASVTAWIVYVLLFLFLVLLVHRVYSDYYRKQRLKLIARQQKELEIKQLESRQEIMTLENQKLENDMASKNRELAATTMSLIKKNELLTELKDRLSAVKDRGRIDDVISFINKNMEDEDNWKLFEEAFNNADQDFLHAIKRRHPDLTPNDLKLCAYLRLNLSSKEIAPILNISVRSVEIKRYRLRKKMKLDHKKGLAEYILDF